VKPKEHGSIQEAPRFLKAKDRGHVWALSATCSAP
jgi:hypothetical protein